MAFNYMIVDMINNKKLNSIVTEVFIRGKTLNISLVFITQSDFKVPKDARLSTTHFFIIKIPNKRELQQNCIKSFIRYRIWRFYEDLWKMYSWAISFFS